MASATSGARFINYLTTSHGYLTIMPKLRPAYDGRLMLPELFLGKIHLQNRKIVGDSVSILVLAYGILNRNVSTL